jgi:hypothetical protein
MKAALVALVVAAWPAVHDTYRFRGQFWRIYTRP